MLVDDITGNLDALDNIIGLIKIEGFEFKTKRFLDPRNALTKFLIKNK